MGVTSTEKQFLANLVIFLAIFSRKIGHFSANSWRNPVNSITINIFGKLESETSFDIHGPELRLLSTKRATFQKWARAPF